jgi:hypothetical protein
MLNPRQILAFAPWQDVRIGSAALTERTADRLLQGREAWRMAACASLVVGWFDGFIPGRHIMD